MNNKRWIILLIAAVLVTGAVSILLTRKIVLDKVDKGEIYIKADSYDEILDIYELRNIKKLIGEYYYKDIDFEKILREGASYGMVRELSDGYSSYYSEELFNLYYDTSVGYSDITSGMLLKEDKDYILVEKVFEGTSAYEAGILEGDRIILVDDLSVKAVSFDLIKSYMKGLEGTTYEVTLERGDEVMTLTVVRTDKEIRTVEYLTVSEDTGYIRVTEFSNKADEEFIAAVDDLQKARVKNLVIDLRNVRKGDIEKTIACADLFIENVTFASVESKGAEGIYYSATEGVTFEGKITVLVDGGTSEMAELFAYALKSNAGARIAGTTTSGRTVITSLYKIPSSGSMLRLVTGTYLGGGNQVINDVGLTPDREADLSQYGHMLGKKEVLEILETIA
ncbi:MAG: PDZ domain-containing protein [Clostridia bacterium]|jgi:carboxyl-terminal processing protease|nr:PDZ domain-containing protein [Clostridia bacterium]MBQ6003917.1 PDZ domain-containing protein [Clostridia bacterium]MBR0439004.1 PDZ domain-containing protein [Clostridia bacterium]